MFDGRGNHEDEKLQRKLNRSLPGWWGKVVARRAAWQIIRDGKR